MDPKDEIKAKVDIVELVGEYVKLKKAGKNFKGLCPFHTEKTPSFMVSPDRQSWHCFGCSKGGDSFSFLMEIEGMDFPEAMRTLGARVGIEIQSRNIQFESTSIKERILAANSLAQSYFHYLLTQHETGRRGRAYLSERGLLDETIQTFQLGYAPNSWDATSKFLQTKGFSSDELLQAGLLVPSDRGRPYDRFRGRVMFPLRDIHGNVVGFAGRTLTEESAKYVNSPETPVFTKGRTLFGLDQTKQDIRTAKNAVLVEGEMDMLMAYQDGVKWTVAVKGTALTDDQIQLLKRYTHEAIVCFDPDVAGTSATLRGIERAHALGLGISVVSLPDGLDPADYIRARPGTLTVCLGHAQGIYDFWMETIVSQFQLENPTQKRRAVEAFLPVLAGIENRIEQTLIVERFATLVGVDLGVVKQELARLRQPRRVDIAAPPVPPGRAFSLPKREQYFFTVLFLGKSVKKSDLEGIAEMDFVTTTGKAVFALLFSQLQEYNERDAEDVLKHLPLTMRKVVQPLVFAEISEDLDRERELRLIKRSLRHARIRRQLRETSRLLKIAQARKEMDQIESYETELSHLTQDLQELYP
ncbi:MAG: DNA primase [bacterium]|nr:DNA primase [bacterium]